VDLIGLPYDRSAGASVAKPPLVRGCDKCSSLVMYKQALNQKLMRPEAVPRQGNATAKQPSAWEVQPGSKFKALRCWL
jgi:hypothetical protein